MKSILRILTLLPCMYSPSLYTIDVYRRAKPEPAILQQTVKFINRSFIPVIASLVMNYYKPGEFTYYEITPSVSKVKANGEDKARIVSSPFVGCDKTVLYQPFYDVQAKRLRLILCHTCNIVNVLTQCELDDRIYFSFIRNVPECIPSTPANQWKNVVFYDTKTRERKICDVVVTRDLNNQEFNVISRVYSAVDADDITTGNYVMAQALFQEFFTIQEQKVPLASSSSPKKEAPKQAEQPRPDLKGKPPVDKKEKRRFC